MTIVIGFVVDNCLFRNYWKYKKLVAYLRLLTEKHAQHTAISSQQNTSQANTDQRQKAASWDKERQGQSCDKTEMPKMALLIKGVLAHDRNIHNQGASQDGCTVNDEACDKDHCILLF